MTTGPTDTNQDLSTFVVREFQSAVPRAITWWPPGNYIVFPSIGIRAFRFPGWGGDGMEGEWWNALIATFQRRNAKLVAGF